MLVADNEQVNTYFLCLIVAVCERNCIMALTVPCDVSSEYYCSSCVDQIKKVRVSQ
jgi:hypothetical protein